MQTQVAVSGAAAPRGLGLYRYHSTKYSTQSIRVVLVQFLECFHREREKDIEELLWAFIPVQSQAAPKWVFTEPQNGSGWKGPRWGHLVQPLLQQGRLRAQDCATRGFWNISREGDSKPSLGSVQCLITAQGRNSASCPGGISWDQFLPVPFFPLLGSPD